MLCRMRGLGSEVIPRPHPWLRSVRKQSLIEGVGFEEAKTMDYRLFIVGCVMGIPPWGMVFRKFRILGLFALGIQLSGLGILIFTLVRMF